MNLTMLVAAAVLAAPWRSGLYVGNGGLWRQRVRVEVRNGSASAAAGAPVTVRIGRATGEADLVGAEASAVRVCNERGAEMLFDIAAADGASVHRGAIPQGAVLTLPAECAANATAAYYVYFDNPRAWQVPDYLAGGGSLRNGGMEQGSGDAPDGWKHDEADAEHRASWTTETSHSGKRSLKTVVAPGAEPTWIATRQNGLRIAGGAHYVMTAWVKGADVVGQAGWYIHVGSAKDAMLVSPMLNAGSGTYDWKQVRAEFTAPVDADRADLGTVLRGTGTAWFDDVTLERLDGQDALTATAGPRERLPLAEPAPAPWPAASSPLGRLEHRTALRVMNPSDAPLSGLISVRLADGLTSQQARVQPGAIRVAVGGKVVPHYVLGDALLFRATVPARSIGLAYVYFTTERVTAAAPPADRGVAAVPAAYAPNPALPGGETRGVGRVRLSDYAALLASPANLARNPSFETGRGLPDAWEGGAEGAKPAGAEMGLAGGGLFGTRCGRIHIPATATPAWTGWRQSVPVKPGHTYLYASWLKCSELQGSLQIHAHLLTSGGELVKEGAMTGAGPAISGTQGWTLMAGSFTVPDDCEQFQMHLTMLATGTAWHDGVILADVTPGEVADLATRPAASQTAVAVWPVNAIVKVFREDAPPARPAAARITCAGAEEEPLQVAVRSPRSLAGVRAQVVAPVGPGGATLKDWRVGVVGYVPMDHASNYYSNQSPAYYRKLANGPGASDGWAGMWPDPLLPRDTFDLAAGRTQPVWVTFRVPRGAKAGDYRGTVRLEHGGRAIASLPFTVHVWGFSLPDAPRFKAVYDVRQGGGEWQLPGKTQTETLRAFWRFMADHRLSPDRIEPDPKFTYRDGKVTADFTAYDEAAKIYFDDMKFAHSYTPSVFYLFGWAFVPSHRFGEKPYDGEPPYTGVDRTRLRPEYKRAYQACLKAYWDHVKAKGWADRITLYISDEPFLDEKPVLDQMKAICDMIHEVDPAIPIYSSTWRHTPAWDGYITVWGFGHYGLVPASTMKKVREGGATIWWTTDGMMCTDTPYCAIERLLPHYANKYGAKAYEFWGVDWLTYDPYQYGWHSFISQSMGNDRPQEWVRYPNGDGYLAYPPGPLKLDRAVPSIRLEQAREGEEDYEYLAALRDLVSKRKAAGQDASLGERALAQANALVDSPCDIGRYSTRILPDPDQVFRVKEAVAAAIERLR